MTNPSKKNQINLSILVLAILSAVSTVYQEVELFSQTEVNNLSCGWPMRYFFNAFPESRWGSPYYPSTRGCIDFIYGEWGDPINVQWVYFILDIVFFYLLLSVLFNGGRIVIRRMQRKK